MVSSPAKDPDQMLAAVEMGKVIAKIIERHGVKVLDDRRKLLGLLRDYAPAEFRGVKLLMASYDQNTPQSFVDHGAPPAKDIIDQQANALVANAGLQRDLASWATEAWSAGLYGKAGSIAAAPPVTDDLTWGSETIAEAPAATTPAVLKPAPNAAASKINVAPQSTAAKRPINKFLVGCLIVAALAGAAGIYYNVTKHQQLVQEAPAAPPQDTPATPPAAPAQQTAGDPVQADGTPWIITSMSDDSKQWPLFNGDTHPKDVANDWEFSFNSRLSDGRLAVFAINVSMGADMKTGTGYVRGLDLAVKDTSKMSVSPWSPVVREFRKDSKSYVTTISAPAWDKNETTIPPICVSFSSGSNVKLFQPENGLFCVSEWSNGTCSVNIGCGRVN